MKKGYALADATTQDFSEKFRGAHIVPNVDLWHTTEGMTWPSYGGGESAPTYTTRPVIAQKRLAWRQHFPEDMSARALRNEAGGVETNTLNCIQIEMIGTCSPGVAADWKRRGYDQDVDFIFWPQAPDWALQGIADFIADQHKRLDIPLTIAPPHPWPAYPDSINDARFSFSEWRAFRGQCGHMHAPENYHGDPGRFPMGRVIGMVKDGKSTRVSRARDDLQEMIAELRRVEMSLEDVPAIRKHVHQVAGEVDTVRQMLKGIVKELPER